MRRFWKAAGALAVAACTMFAGAATANAADVTYKENPITLSNVRVSDVGAHTANVSFDYSIDPAQVSQIKDVCFSIEVQRITDITPIQSAAMNHIGQGDVYSVNCDSDSGVSDDELTAGSYDAIYGVHNDMEYKGAFHDSDATHSTWWEDPNELAFKASGQHFYRYNKDDWNGKASGSFDFPLIGLTSNTAYTNNAKACKPSASTQCEFGDSLIIDQEAIRQTENVLWDKGVRVKTPVDVRQVILYAQPIYKDANTKVSTWSGDNFLKQVPDFTTKAEPTATSAELLPSETETKLSVVGGKVQPGQTARVYVDNLKADAKAKADANSLFWNAYIYSEPQALTSPDGAPFVRVQKEKSTGKYYFDAVIPAGLPAGDHKISVQDDNGAVQALTAVTVGDAPAQTVDKSKLTAAIESAGKLAEKDYTSASWTAFSKALADAKAVAGKQDASQAEVDAAVKGLTDAQAALKKADASDAKPTNGNNGSTKPSGDNKTAADGKKAGLARTGASVAAVAGVLVLLTALGAGLKVMRSRH